MNSKSHVAVVGTGFIGPIHVEGLRRAGVSVHGILGSNLAKSQAAQAELGLPKAYARFDEILHDPEITSVHIATPNHLHFEQAKAVLLAGKHVLCEKPLAMNSKQSLALVELAQKNNLAAGVAYNIRFYPLCHEVRSQLQTGRLGEFIHINGSYTQDWLLKPTDFNWRVQSSEGGELRAIADIGTHWLDLVQFITGHKVVSVFSDLRTVYDHRLRPAGGVETFSGKSKPKSNLIETQIDTEDCGSILLRFSNGANGCLWVSQMTAGRKNCLKFELSGTQSSVSWNSETPNQIEVGQRDQPNELLIRDPSLLSDSAAGLTSYPGGHNEGFSDSFKQLFKSFYGYIERGDFLATPPFPTFAEGHHEVLICEAILKSHKEERWITIG